MNKRRHRRKRTKTFKSLLRRRLKTTPAKLFGAACAAALLAFSFYITVQAGG